MQKWLQLRALFVLFTSYPHLFTSYTAIVQKKYFYPCKTNTVKLFSLFLNVDNVKNRQKNEIVIVKV